MLLFAKVRLDVPRDAELDKKFNAEVPYARTSGLSIVSVNVDDADEAPLM